MRKLKGIIDVVEYTNLINYKTMDNPLFDDGNNNDDRTYDELLQEIYYLNEKIAFLEKNNINLCNRLNETQNLKAQLEQSILMQTQNNTKLSIKKHKKKEHTPEKKAIELHYEEHKKSKELRNIIKNNMKKAGYELDRIPIKLLKIECLRLYNALTTEEKQKYFIKTN